MTVSTHTHSSLLQVTSAKERADPCQTLAAQSVQAQLPVAASFRSLLLWQLSWNPLEPFERDTRRLFSARSDFAVNL